MNILLPPTRRKAFRLGKFLQDVNSLRHSQTKDAQFVLELVAYGGEGIYYFLEQFTWLVKTGALSKDLEERLAYASALAELVGYAGNIWLSFLKLQKLMQQEREVEATITKTCKVGKAAKRARERGVGGWHARGKPWHTHRDAACPPCLYAPSCTPHRYM